MRLCIRVLSIVFGLLSLDDACLCAQTMSAYDSPAYQEVRVKTQTPSELGNSVFYKRYIQGKYAKSIAKTEIDEQGNITTLRTPPEMGPDIYAKEPRVDFDGPKHWNLKRFFYEPWFAPESAESPNKHLLATEELYAYFLFLDQDRSLAWNHTVDLMAQEIDPLLQSGFHQFRQEASLLKYYFSVDTVYDPNARETNLFQVFSEINRAARRGDVRFEVYDKKRALDVYQSYFLLYRKNPTEEAFALASECFQKELKQFKAEKQQAKSKADRRFYKDSRIK